MEVSPTVERLLLKYCCKFKNKIELILDFIDMEMFKYLLSFTYIKDSRLENICNSNNNFFYL